MYEHVREQSLVFPKGYKPSLDLIETELAIKFIKDDFQKHLSRALHLKRVSAPLFVLQKSGINDYLSGVERPVDFKIKDMGEIAEIVQSLAKWKRMALADYGFGIGQGLYTDMNAIRPDEHLDNLHSLYVDQWDWEKVIQKSSRTLRYLKATVETIYGAIRQTERRTCKKFKRLGEPILPKSIHFVHSEDLEALYPNLTPQEREVEICREKGAVFIIGIGSPLSDGKPHDSRAADYDDWITKTTEGHRGLNGDIIVWNPLLEKAFELSSMGVRVDKQSLNEQCEVKNVIDRLELPFHQCLLNNKLPLSIGGGIGQSRLCMFYLRKAHIGEVQSGIWPTGVRESCKRHGIPLL